MLELSTFIEAMPSSGVKVLPLFYDLSPQDLKDKEKLAEWHKRWEGFAAKDGRIKVSSWSHALQRLSSINGLIFKESDGELAYLQEIESAIYEMIPPRLKFSHAGIQGRDRLCKVLIDKFEELEQRLQCQPSADVSKVCVLGVYGLPGSGKTTLSACLCDHFSSAFAGRVLHLKLDIDPTPTQLLASAKELLKLTNFHQHKEKLMSHVVDLPQMFSILQVSDLRSSRVFLVIDNISSQDSIESVQAMLRLVGVGAGSRVMLVARTMEVLRPVLDISNYYHGHIQYACDSVRVPSITEKEAIRVLIQPTSGLASASDNYSGEIKEETCSSSHQEILIKLARLCAFGTQPPYYVHQDLLYLPLALKIIGSQLRSNGLDLEKWERQSSHLETMVKEFKGDAVRTMVERSFQNLRSEKLKLIFLDVALFLVRHYCFGKIEYEVAIELLSFMHECSPDTMKRQVNELIRLCFLELGSSDGTTNIVVHDVFLEFARSVPHASSMYDCWGNVSLDSGRSVHKSKADLRALILEVDEKCERFNFPAGLSRVAVVVIRNGKSLAMLGLAGLTSLVSLDVVECPRLRCVEFDPAHACTLKRVKWAKQSAGQGTSDHAQLLQGSFLRNLLQMSHEGSAIQAGLQLMYKGWCGLSGDLMSGSPQRALNGAMSQLKALQVLRLQGTGITSLGDLSSSWPQLRVLEVLEDRLEEIELGNLPNLKQFFFGHSADRKIFVEYWDPCVGTLRKRGEPRMPKKPNLLAGCPELEDVRICLPSCEDGMGSLVIPSPNLQRLWLKHIHSGEPVLADFTSSAHSLEEMHVCDHRVVQSIDFTRQFWSLVRIQLHTCPNLIKITGLECLPKLRDLEIEHCSQLQALGNLEAVRMLERLVLWFCPALVLTSQGLSTLEFLKVIRCRASPNVQLLWSDLENLTTLSHVSCSVFGNMLKLEKLVNLQMLSLIDGEKCEGQAACHELSLCCSINGDPKCEQVLSTSKYMPLLLFRESAPAHLSELSVGDVQDLVCLDGIHCLPTLRILCLEHLPKLASLQGLQYLTHLRDLSISTCMAVKELPSLCTLVNLIDLYITHCVNLKSLEGCDKLRSLRNTHFDGCEKLEHCPLVAEQLSSTRYPFSVSFRGCKFASIEAMVGWLVDEDAKAAVSKASVDGLVWKLSYVHLLEKPAGERMQLAEQVLETLGACLARKLPALTLDTCFDFQPWVDALKNAWTYELDLANDPRWRRGAAPSFPRGMERLLQGLGRVPLRVVLEQCQSEAQFRASVANCLLQTDPWLLQGWPDRLREGNSFPHRHGGRSSCSAVFSEGDGGF